MKAGVAIGVAAAVLLGGCEAKIGKDPESGAGNSAAASAEAGDGSVSVDIPGFQMKVSLPANLRNSSSFNDDGELLYPGATLKGLHIQARNESQKGVELNFTTADGPEAVNSWYRDPARKKYRIVRDASEGGSTLIEAAETDGDDLYTIRLTPRPSGGTDGAIRIRDRS